MKLTCIVAVSEQVGVDVAAVQINVKVQVELCFFLKEKGNM